MANRYLYMGLHAAFTRNVGTVSNSTSTASFDSAYTDQSTLVSSNTSHFFADFQDSAGADDHATAAETLWLRFDGYYSGSSTNTNMAVLVDDADQMLFRLRVNSSTVTRVEYNSGTLASPTWTQLGTDITTASGTRYTWVIKLTIDPAGTAHTYEVYKNSSLALSGTFSMGLLTRIDAVKFGDTSNTTCAISQVLASVGISLVGSYCAALKADAAGSNSGMTGAYTDVNEVTVLDTSGVMSDTAGQRTTFSMGNVTIPATLVVGTEQRHTFRATSGGGTSPLNLKPVIRSGGTDTVGSAVSGLGVGFSAFSIGYNASAAQINAAGFELGWESSA